MAAVLTRIPITCSCPKVIDGYTNKPRQGFDRHDLRGSEKYLGKLRPMGRRRRWNFEGGKYDTGYPNRYYRVRSTAFEALHAARGYDDQDMGVYLDAGCGDSPDADIALLTGYSRAYGVDLFRPMIHLSDEDFDSGRFSRSPMRLTYDFILGDICEQLPIEDSSIDAISSNWVVPLMCPEDRLTFYVQVKRMLKPDSLFSLAANVLTSGYCHKEDSDNGIFSMDREIKRLEKAGLKIIQRGDSYVIAKSIKKRKS